jgi:hypothetical protein
MQPPDVQRFLQGDVSDDVLQEVLDELRADPNWVVLEPYERPPECIFQMVYQPTRTPYGFPAVRVHPGLWHFPAER